MEVREIIKNTNFTAEFPYVVRITDEEGEIVLEFKSWEDSIPEEVLNAEVIWLNVVAGYAELHNMACMIIDIFQPEIY